MAYHGRREPRAECAEIDERSSIIGGRNAVLEMLKSGRPIDKIWLKSGGEGSLKLIAAMAKGTRYTAPVCRPSCSGRHTAGR